MRREPHLHCLRRQSALLHVDFRACAAASTVIPPCIKSAGCSGRPVRMKASVSAIHSACTALWRARSPPIGVRHQGGALRTALDVFRTPGISDDIGLRFCASCSARHEWLSNARTLGAISSAISIITRETDLAKRPAAAPAPATTSQRAVARDVPGCSCSARPSRAHTPPRAVRRIPLVPQLFERSSAPAELREQYARLQPARAAAHSRQPR